MMANLKYGFTEEQKEELEANIQLIRQNIKRRNPQAALQDLKKCSDILLNIHEFKKEKQA